MYKAGDFTNGKMNEIFKTAYHSGLTQVNHKQFGKFTMVSEECAADMVMMIMLQDPDFAIQYDKIYGMDTPLLDLCREDQLQAVSDHCWQSANCWAEMLHHIIRDDYFQSNKKGLGV